MWTTCHSTLHPILFGVNPHNIFSKSTIGVQPIISANIRETQVPEEEDQKGALPCSSLNMKQKEGSTMILEKKKEVHTPPASFSDYSPGLGQVLVKQEGAFQDTRSKIAIPYSYG